MATRGKIMRDPTMGPGLVMVQGQQYSFALEGVWRSETLPRPGLVVNVELDAGGRVSTITAVPEAQLAREQAEAALALAKERGGALASGLLARFGAPRLIAAALLVLGWFFLSTVTVNAAFLGNLKFTFWQVLGFLNVSNPMDLLAGGRNGPSSGIYGFAAILCLAGPFLAHFWKDARAHLGGALPLLFMLIVALLVRSSIANAMSNNGGSERAYKEMSDALSIGAGLYLSALASLYLAATGLKGFLVTRASDKVSAP